MFEDLIQDRRNDYLTPDSTLVQAHQQAATGTRLGKKGGGLDLALGRSRGGLTTKIHMACDGEGRPVRFLLAPGQAGDVLAAPALIQGFRPQAVMADRAYDSNALWQRLADINAQAVIPSTC